jgi:acyl-CoA thioesterase-2
VRVPEQHHGDVTDLATLLDLEELDRDLYRGRNARHREPRVSLYGGQVAAQALRAASLTVPNGRFPHSLHGYFLRAGRPDHRVIFAVDRDRDGGSFSARHVRALQHGEVIFSMLASFKTDEPGGEFEAPPSRAVGPPEDYSQPGWDSLTESREVRFRQASGVTATDSVWVRAPGSFPDDRVLHACALTYMSDYGSGFVMLDEPGVPWGGPSIDHVVWFHEPIRADDWVLLDMHPVRVSDARGTYIATMRDRDGNLGAVLGQEMLLRMPPAPSV